MKYQRRFYKANCFSIYTEQDEQLCRKANDAGYYLIGGTAIEIWCDFLGITWWRKRSNNDIDLFLPDKFSNRLISGTWRSITDFIEYLAKNNIPLPDLYINEDLVSESWMCRKISGYKVMSPGWMFITKCKRYSECDNPNRRLVDYKDLKTLKELIKLNNEESDFIDYCKKYEFDDIIKFYEES